MSTSHEAMQTMATAAGSLLKSLPDGEVDRQNWILTTINSLRDHPDLRQIKKGDWINYKDDEKFRIKKGHKIDPESIYFGYAKAAEVSYPDFEKLREDIPDLAKTDFQVGLGSDLDMAFFSFGPLRAFTMRDLFRAGLVHEVGKVLSKTGTKDVVFQFEMPVETVLTTVMPGPLGRLVGRFMARGAAKTARHLPLGLRFGLHLCYGDLGNKSLVKPRSAAGLVRLTNALAKAWPADHPLEYVHLPLAFGDVPPVTDEKFYRPLAKLRLPESIRLIAGIAHEDQPLEEQLKVREIIERHAGRQVDIASACGLGRRDAPTAKAALDRAVELAKAES